MLEKFKQIFDRRYELLNKKKAEGKKIIGWTCTYVPEEILHAAGLLPIRIMGRAEETPIADAYMYSNICSFVRNCLEEAFRKKYDFLDGYVGINACDHMRRIYDVWKAFLPTPFTHIIGVPCKQSESTLDFFIKEFILFKRRIEEFFQVEITDIKLLEAIRLYNKTRALFREIYELRKQDHPPISGSEIMDIFLAGLVMPKEEYNVLLEKYLKEIKSRKVERNGRIRLMITGSELDDSEYIKAIEDLGSIVVVDDLCNGTRYFWNPVPETDNPIEALARRYLTRAPCARMRPQKVRMDHLQSLAKEYRVEGLIYENIKFCGPYGGVFPIIKKGFNQLGIPILSLQREYMGGGTGQLKTRVQAFFEQIEEER
jgi:bzd-type benzoyl-CoA reductase N subunit